MSSIGGWRSDLEDSDEAEFGSSVSRWAHAVVVFIALFFIVFLIWADNATLDEVTRGDGRVIPSSQIQVIDHLEGGIVRQIMVREGEVVDAGQPLIQIENRAAEAELAEKRKQYLNLLATAARLEAESNGLDTIDFPDDVILNAPEVAQNEQQLFQRREQQLEQQVRILEDQWRQKQNELRELTAKTAQLARSIDIAQRELDLIAPLVDAGASPLIDKLRAESKLSELEAELEGVELALPRTRIAVSEALGRMEEKTSSFRTEAQQELNRVSVEAARLSEEIDAGVERAVRTEIRSPVRGTVNTLLVGTIGASVRPGDDLVEIVPLEDSLLVEARIRPADRAELYPGQAATVKVTAYDFSIYGGLDATLVDISADTITDDQGETFYRIRLRTDRNNLGQDQPIIPGMTATVDILTGEKTVLNYLMKPILKARENALRER